MTPEVRVAAAEICRVGQSLYQRGYARATGGQISLRLDNGVLITPLGASLGALAPERLAWIDARGVQRGGERPARGLELHRRLHALAPEAGCVLHVPSTQLVALTLHGVWSAQDVLPPLTPVQVLRVGHVPLLPYHRPDDPRMAEFAAAQVTAYAARGTPIRALLLERIGPVVWQRSPAEASAVLEELEEAARLWLAAGPKAAPLAPAQLDELRREFGPVW